MKRKTEQRPALSPEDRGPADLADLRKEYALQALLESEAGLDPLKLFRRWLGDARSAGLPEPNAMTLATASPEGRPSARIVLLKGMDAKGFEFFTNYRSRKGVELRANQWAALVFFWPELERQVRVEGRVSRLSPKDSDAYFQRRPRASRIAAWAAEQSQVIANRDVLDRRFAEFAKRYRGRPVPRPPHWGGFVMVPESIEFWQGRPNRLHDRLRYWRQPRHRWLLERLAP